MESAGPSGLLNRPQWRFAGMSYVWFFTIFFGLCVASAAAGGRYRDGDWVGYTSTRYITFAAVGHEYVYFGSSGGILRFDRFRDRWDGMWTTIDGLPSNRVLAVAYDPELERLHARTVAGDAVYDQMTHGFELDTAFPESLMVFWRKIELLNYNLPLEYSAVEEEVITDRHLRDFFVQGVINDDWGDYWVGTWGQGVWHGRRYDPNLEQLPHGLAHSNVWAIDRLKTCWWFGGPALDSGLTGITVYDTLRETWEYLEARYTDGFDSDEALQIVHTGDTVWMATAAGLTRYCETEADKFRTYNVFDGLFSDVVTAVEPDGDVLWIGTDHGINALLIPQDSVVRATDRLTNGAYVYDIEVIDDFVWMGTDYGLFSRYKELGDWRRFSAAQSILNGNVYAITHDDTAFYFGTDFGLAMVLRDGSGVQEYISGNIFPGGDIYALAVTDRIVWASTASGLVRFDPRTERYRLFDRSDGLFDDFVQVIYPDGDYLWLGTQEGVQRFYWNSPYRID